MNAFRGRIRNRFKLHWKDEEETEQPVTLVEIPAEIAREIFALAELTGRKESESLRLGGALQRAGMIADPTFADERRAIEKALAAPPDQPVEIRLERLIR